MSDKIKGLIYMATNKANGKVYVGKTSRAFEKRVSEHKYNSLYSKYGNNKFYNSIRKYGFDCFVWTILEDNIDNMDNLNNREIFWIAEKNSYYTGLNSSKGGEGNLGCKHSEATKQKISEAKKGIALSEEHREKVSIGLKGIKRSEDTRKRMSEAQRGIGGTITIDQVVQIKTELVQGLGNAHLSRKYGISVGLIKEIKNCRCWAYVLPELNEKLVSSIANRERDKSRCKGVLQINADTNEIIASFQSLNEASKATGIGTGNISSVCRGAGRHKRAGGYIWRYKEEANSN